LNHQKVVVYTQKRQLPPDGSQRPEADGHHEEFDEQCGKAERQISR
jgi:hypothetical protein